MLFSADAVV